MPNKTTQILKEFREKFVRGVPPMSIPGGGDMQDAEAWIEADIEDMEDFIWGALEAQQQEDYQERDKYYAYCACGDTLERTGLYPKDATYYCFGCDKTYKLFHEIYQEIVDLDIMKDEELEIQKHGTCKRCGWGIKKCNCVVRNKFRKELRQALADKLLAEKGSTNE